MEQLLGDFTLEEHFLAFILGAARLAMFIIVAPFMGSSVLAAGAKGAIILALYLILHPMMLASFPDVLPFTATSFVAFAGLILKEVFLGFILGYLSGMAFWAVESAGFFIDNQRGASMAQQSDPLSGEETSPTGSFLFQSTVYVFFATGCFLTFLSVLYGTYVIWSPAEWLPAKFFSEEAALFFAGAVAKLAVNMVLLAAPVVLACLFTDISLGLINRFASQLNVYILAMPIKSAIASFLLIFYFAVLMTDAPERFALFNLDLAAMQRWLP